MPLALLSGGIDSAVAAHMMKCKNAVFFYNHPFSCKTTLDRAKTIAKKLKLNLTVLDHGNALTAFSKNCERKYQCVLCKRQMVRVASRIADDFLVMGDSLGQVASQTLQNIHVVEEASLVPVVRPLVGVDKEEIILEAKRIGTFIMSTEPAVCCTAVPDKPSTRAELEKIHEEEAKVDIERLVVECLSTLK